MRSLKPKETSANALSVKAAADLQNEITRLQEQIVQLRNSIDEIESTLDSPNVGRGDATFGTLQSADLSVDRNATLQKTAASELTADKIETPDIEAENATVTNVLDANQINTPKLNADEVKTDSVQSDEVQTDSLTSDTIATGSLTASTATIDTANISTANIGNYSTNKVTAVEVETASLSTDEVTTETAEMSDLSTTNAEIENAEIEKTRIENRYYISDKPGKTIQLTQVEEQHPAWICLDTRGVQNAKIVAKDLTGELFSVIYTNTRHTPLIQWSKRNEQSLQRFFYNYKTNKLYLETWSSCEFQWQIDGYEETPFIPSTYQDDFPDSLLDCYKYSVNRKHGIVLMGEKGADTVLSVQGMIEGQFLIDNGKFTYLDFYSDSAWDLFNVAKSFFRSGSDEDGWQYEKAECFGYLKHTLDSTSEHYEYTEHEGSFSDIYVIGEETLRYIDPRSLESIGFTPTRYLSSKVESIIEKSYTDVYVKDDNTGEYKAVKYTWSIRLAGKAYLSDTIFLDSERNFIQAASDEEIYPKVKYYIRESTPGGTTNPYMDEDGTVIEALEKVEYVDENTIKLTIDNQYGQDEIVINGEDLQEDEKLPFLLGFTIRTPKVDYTFNSEAKMLTDRSDNSYYGG